MLISSHGGVLLRELPAGAIANALQAIYRLSRCTGIQADKINLVSITVFEKMVQKLKISFL
jgi:hypothetical protein